MKKKVNSTCGLSLKRFIEIANKYHYSVEISSYSGRLVGFDSFFKSPYGMMIETKSGFSYDSLKRAFDKCLFD